MSLQINGANQPTEWFDLSAAASDVCFNLDGDFVDAVTVQYSNDNAYVKASTSIRTDATAYSTPAGPLQFPFGVAKFVRFTSGGVWTAGKLCVPRFSVAKDATGHLFTPTTQQNITAPVTA